MTRRERVPRKATVEGSRLDAPYQLGGDPNGNRAQRRAAARNGKRPRIDSPASDVPGDTGGPLEPQRANEGPSRGIPGGIPT